MILTPAQLRFIGAPRGRVSLFMSADPSRLRAQWLGEEGRPGGRVIGPVTDPANPPPEAVRVKVYRLSDGGGEGEGPAFRGALDAQRVLDVVELPGLAHLWAEPLRTLNAQGRALALADPEPLARRTFTLPPEKDAWLAARAAELGTSASAVLLRLIAAEQERLAAEREDERP